MSPEAHKRMLETRYLDDWAYQAYARQDVAQSVIWPQGLPAQGLAGKELQMVEQAVAESIVKTAEPVMGGAVHDYSFVLPWQRLFEVEPVLKVK